MLPGGACTRVTEGVGYARISSVAANAVDLQWVIYPHVLGEIAVAAVVHEPCHVAVLFRVHDQGLLNGQRDQIVSGRWQWVYRRHAGVGMFFIWSCGHVPQPFDGERCAVVAIDAAPASCMRDRCTWSVVRIDHSEVGHRYRH